MAHTEPERSFEYRCLSCFFFEQIPGSVAQIRLCPRCNTAMEGQDVGPAPCSARRPHAYVPDRPGGPFG